MTRWFTKRDEDFIAVCITPFRRNAHLRKLHDQRMIVTWIGMVLLVLLAAQVTISAVELFVSDEPVDRRPFFWMMFVGLGTWLQVKDTTSEIRMIKLAARLGDLLQKKDD